MANYYAATRSNYFRVKDRKAFEAWCRDLSLEFWTDDGKGGVNDTFYAVTADTLDCSGWPSYNAKDEAEIDFIAELADHLDPRDVAILFEAGSEKLRYVVGMATAVHADGRTISVNLSDIYTFARQAFGWKVTITEGSY